MPKDTNSGLAEVDESDVEEGSDTINITTTTIPANTLFIFDLFSSKKKPTPLKKEKRVLD
jgi:hypothetical protein